jgi:hypothetical protein
MSVTTRIAERFAPAQFYRAPEAQQPPPLSAPPPLTTAQEANRIVALAARVAGAREAAAMAADDLARAEARKEMAEREWRDAVAEFDAEAAALRGEVPF